MKGLENDRRRRPREYPKGTSSCTCALPYFPGEALWVTFDDVISGQKAPLVRILHNVRLCMCTPFQRTPSVSRDVTFGSHVGHAQWYILYYYSKKEVREPVVHADAITSVTSVPVRAASNDMTSGDVTSGRISWQHLLKYYFVRTDILLLLFEIFNPN